VRFWTPATAPSRICPQISTSFLRFTASGRRLRVSSGKRRGTDSVGQDVVVVHTDGGCRPNPGPGGWGAVLRQREHVREMCGGESGQTSNNRMELTAPIMALEALTRPVVVHLYTDSTYVRNGITKWILGWERNGWMTAAKQPVKNADLWRRLQMACALHQVEWFWVKGHSGVADNELADVLATRGMQEAIAASGGSLLHG
jgi:ribonuclease HI